VAEQSDTEEPRDTKAVSIGLGSIFVIGLLLWFFTSGIRTEVQKLRNEVREVRALLESDTKNAE